MKFLSNYVFKPSHEVMKGIRGMLAQAGVLKDLDRFNYYSIEDPLFYFLFTQAYDFKIVNDGVIPTVDEGCCLFATNHQSILDPIVSGLAIVHNSRRFAWQLTKAELFDHPMFGTFVAANYTIPIRRGENDTDALQRCLDEMKINNNPVLVYPEGTYGPGTADLLPFKTGIARLAWDAQLPVIPMATHGLANILPKEDFKSFKTSGKLRVGFGPRLNLSTLFPGKKAGQILEQNDFKAATAQIQDAVQSVWKGLDAEFQ